MFSNPMVEISIQTDASNGYEAAWLFLERAFIVFRVITLFLPPAIQIYTFAWKFSCLRVMCGDSQNCVDSVSCPTLVGDYPTVGSDQITLTCADSVCFCMHSSYIYVFMLMYLIASAQSSSSFMLFFYATTHTHLGKGIKNTLSNLVLNSIMGACVLH